ncbi:hypothetical protein CRUP_018716 [Coryphaenoides rupestris]|nr:hypothetical protein CRUP_018716 [Coryphaenoides rupestris]
MFPPNNTPVIKLNDHKRRQHHVSLARADGRTERTVASPTPDGVTSSGVDLAGAAGAPVAPGGVALLAGRPAGLLGLQRPGVVLQRHLQVPGAQSRRVQLVQEEWTLTKSCVSGIWGWETALRTQHTVRRDTLGCRPCWHPAVQEGHPGVQTLLAPCCTGGTPWGADPAGTLLYRRDTLGCGLELQDLEAIKREVAWPGQVEGEVSVGWEDCCWTLSTGKTWDSLVIKLEVVDRDASSGSEILHWATHFPYPMYSRDYVYVRRYHVDWDSNLMVLGGLPSPDPETQDFVRVHSYQSRMVIRPHKNGFDYLLTYSDDPQTVFPRYCVNWMVSSGMPDFLDKLHAAALRARNLEVALQDYTGALKPKEPSRPPSQERHTAGGHGGPSGPGQIYA